MRTVVVAIRRGIKVHRGYRKELRETWLLVQIKFSATARDSGSSDPTRRIRKFRAQLGVYLRLLDVAVPSVYGPSADENPTMLRAGS